MREIVTNIKSPNILDLGCGYGLSLYELISSPNTSHYTNGYGIYYSKYTKKDYDEISAFMKKANEDISHIARTFDINELAKNKMIELREHDVNLGLPFKDCFFDLIYSNNSFHYFKNKIFVLEEINRILKSDGIAIIQIDRIDKGYWGKDLVPRFRIEKLTNYTEIEMFFLQKSFKIKLELRMDSFILKMKKGFTKNTHLALNETNSINLNGSATSTGESIIMPSDIRILATTISMIKNGMKIMKPI